MVYELFKWTVVPPSVWMQNRIALCIAIRSNFNLFWISIRIKNTLCALGIWYVMEFYIERWIWTRKWWFWARWPWCTAEYWYCMLQDIINETKKDMKNLHTIFFWFEWILCLDVILDIEPDGWLSVVSCLSILMGCRIAVIKSFHQRWSFEIQCLFIWFLKGILFIKKSMGRFLPSKNHFYSKHSPD